MASVATGPRFSQARRLSAFVAAFALVAGLLGALAPGALAAGPQPTVTIGANSCIGQDACKGATGNIGANSCNGHQACYMAAADIGDSSCNGDQACADAKGQVADGSCNGLWACGPASFETGVRASRIGPHSCIGERACYVTAGVRTARNSCIGRYACEGVAGLHIGRDACQGYRACLTFQGDYSVGRRACIGPEACWAAKGDIGPRSCLGDSACELSMGDIGADSCAGESACIQHGFLTTAAVVGDGSCNGYWACFRVVVDIGNYSCNGRWVCLDLPAAVGDCAHNLPGYVPRVCLEGGYLPDGRIRKGSGVFVGNHIYNTTGADQAKTIPAAPVSTVRFGISVQNDSAVYSDSFTLLASGTAIDGYKVTYFQGTTDITAMVAAGTYTTPSLAPGAKYLITAKVKVKASATSGSSVTRLVAITSLGDGTKQDAVMFTVGVPGVPTP